MNDNNLTQKSLKISGILCLLAALSPVLFLLGSIFNIPILIQPLPKFSSMNHLTAFGLIIGAVAIYLKNARFLAIGLSFVIIIIGITALSFNLQMLGFAILILSLPDGPIKAGQFFALLFGGISLISMTAYLFHSKRFYSYGVKLNDLQVNATFSYACLMLAYLFATPNSGYCKILASNTHSGKIARKIFWTIVLLPPLLGIVTRVGVELRWYDSSVQASLFVSIFTILLLRIVWKVTKNSEYEERQSMLAKEQLSVLLNRVSDSEKKFRGLLEHATDAVLIINKKGNIIFVNKQLKKWFRYEDNELINQPVEVLMPVRYRDRHYHLTQEYILNPFPRQMGRDLEIFGRRKDGSEFPLDIALSPFETPEGLLVTAVMRDMTFQKKQEARNRYILSVSKILSESLDIDQTLLKSLQVIVPELADGCVVRMLSTSSKFIPVTVLHRDAEMEKTLEYYVRITTESPLVKKQFQKIMMTKKPMSLLKCNLNIDQMPLEEELLQAAKKFGIHNYIVIPLVSHSNVIGTISYILNYPGRSYDQEDILFLSSVAERVGLSLENAQLYNEAQRAIKAREEILAVVSHDLKNPAAAIKLRAQALGKLRAIDPESLIKTSKSIQHSIDQMIVLISNLLDSSKIESGTFTVTKKKENIADIISSVVEMMKLIAEQKKIKIEMSIQEDLPLVYCEANRITQVISNLLGNAIKFSHDEGKIRITAMAKDQECIISVSDTGQGIAEEELPKVFDKFWQADKTKKLGSGLGLAIAKGIIEAHGGHIWVESKQDAGSTFTVTIPLATLENMEHLH